MVMFGRVSILALATLAVPLAPLWGAGQSGSAAAATVETSAGTLRITPEVTGLNEPWGVAFLPGEAMLITERGGRLLHIHDGAENAVSGLPEVFAEGQGGLLDVMIPRDFPQSREVWLSYSARVEGGAATAVGFGTLSEDGTALEDFRTVFAGEGAAGGRHFGARLVEASDGAIFLATGDRGTGPDGMAAQDPRSVAGKVVRLMRDGTPAPAIGDWPPGIHSIGHRNIQGATLDLEGRLIVSEHGARGGDEVNRPEAGLNYGWPVISYGVNYNGDRIGEGTEKEGMEQPLHYWDPSIAPSGLMVYSGALIPGWEGDIFSGSLNSDFISRLDPDSAADIGYSEERIASDETGRVRDIREGPDGAIWFLSVQDGTLYRMAP